jgi:hypothetical protein
MAWVDPNRREWRCISRVKGTQTHGFVISTFNNTDGQPVELLVGMTHKNGKPHHDWIRIPANDADIDKLCHELKRAIAGPLGKLALDAELEPPTTTVMEN